ncbi:MAG: outer membrane beta-barrel protein [Balneolaceae bacterium]
MRHFFKMKALTILCILFAGFVQHAYAQKTGIGFRAGVGASTHINEFKFLVNIEQIRLDPNVTENFDAGLIYRNIIADNWRIQLEPGIIRMGARYNQVIENEPDFGSFVINTDSKTNIWYAYMPVLLQLTTTPPDRLEFPKPWAITTYHATFGFYGSYLLDASFRGTNSGAPLGVEFQGDFREDVSDQFRDFGAGVIIGGGLEHGLNSKIGIEARAIFGALSAGDSDILNFNPLNLAVTFNIYFIF